MVFQNPNTWILVMLLLNNLVNFFSSLKSIHTRHLDIHENKFIPSVDAPALFFEGITEFLDRDIAVLSFFDGDHLVLRFDHLNNGHQIELGVIHD
jgi:hypothetical protein